MVGMHGLGKSSLATRLCDRMKGYGYQVVVFYAAVDEPGFIKVLSDSLGN